MRQIDGKFYIDGDKLFHVSGEEVPQDEPLFLFRGRDRNALPVLEKYGEICEEDACNDYQTEGIAARVQAFRDFRRDHPERMKQPGITRGK